MKPPIKRFKLTQKGYYQVITIKKRTGIKVAAVICRWGFCYSLAQEHVPTPTGNVPNSTLEMSWSTFAGDEETSLALITALIQYCRENQIEPIPQNLEQLFLLHLHRGLGYLVGLTFNSIEKMLQVCLKIEL